MEPLSIGCGDASANSGYAPVEGFGKRAINESGFCAATRIRVKLPPCLGQPLSTYGSAKPLVLRMTTSTGQALQLGDDTRSARRCGCIS